MSTSISTSFVVEYLKDATLVFQRTGSYLKNTVRNQPGVVGSSAVFQKIGTGVATTKARHGAITPMNQDHTAVTCTLADFYAGDWVDKLDLAKIKHDEKMAIAQSGAMALGRKIDNQILTALDSTTQTVVTVTVTSSAAIRNGLLEMVENLHENNVPNDGQIFGVVSPRLWSQAMTVEEFASADYVTAQGQSFVSGMAIGTKFKDWLGVKWTAHTDVPGIGTATAKSFVYHKSALGYASGAYAGNVAATDGDQAMAVDISWHGDRAAWFINHSMSGGAVLIDDTGVIEGNHNDTTAIATS